MAVELNSGPVFWVGCDWPLGFVRFTPDDKWQPSALFREIVGKEIFDVCGFFGGSEPYVVFTDGTTFHVTGEECGTVVEISSIDCISSELPEIRDNWNSLLDKIAANPDGTKLD